jgi:phospholipase A1
LILLFYARAIVVCLLLVFSEALRAQTVEANLPPEEDVQTEILESDGPAAILRKRSQQTLLGYRPIYFAYGQPAKIQFSFRSELSEAVPLNFAYTQIIFWELDRESKPFLDATYSPEIFYRLRPRGSKWMDLGLWAHNSNGKAGAESRSYDQSYIRGVYTREWPKVAAAFSVKLKLLYNDEDTNSDIQEYVGPFDFGVQLFRMLDGFFFDQAEVILEAQPGGKFSTDFEKGGYQISMNFHLDGVKMNPAFYLQYYHGYAETLINYDAKVNIFRAGITF